MSAQSCQSAQPTATQRVASTKQASGLHRRLLSSPPGVLPPVGCVKFKGATGVKNGWCGFARSSQGSQPALAQLAVACMHPYETVLKSSAR